MLESFTLETFAGRVGESFVLQDGEHEYGLSLSECRQVGGSEGDRVPFSLTFLGPVDPVLPQRIYAIRHADLGSFELFIVPVARDGNGTSYEAVFT